MRDLLLPWRPILSENLRGGLQILAARKQRGADDDFRAEDGLVVVDVGGAVGAVVAVDILSCKWQGRLVVLLG